MGPWGPIGPWGSGPLGTHGALETRPHIRYAYIRVLEALESKSEARFELSVKKRVLLMMQTMSDDILDKQACFLALPS